MTVGAESVGRGDGIAGEARGEAPGVGRGDVRVAYGTGDTGFTNE